MRNHASVDEITAREPNLLILGPGPGSPQNAGICKLCVHMGFPLFGICLGHQVIAEVFGGWVRRAKSAMHGKISRIYHNGEGLFDKLPQGFAAVRYHSLIVEPDSLPSYLEVTAWTEEGEIMGMQHRELPIAGVQFHPESVASECGSQIFQNSLKWRR